MSGERPKTPKVTVTTDSEDITEKDRSPVEEAFCESFLIQSKSAVENMYASNLYHSQKHAKELKDLERQRYFQMSQMTTKQKEMLKKMNQLQDRQEQIMTEKRKQHLKVASKGRMRPMSTSAISDGERKFPKERARSGSLKSLQPLDLNLSTQRLSRSTQDLSDPSLLSASLPANILSRSFENLAALDKPKKKTVLPAISNYLRSQSCDDGEENTDSTFITRLPPSPPTHPKFNPNSSKFSPELRRGSLGTELDRKLDLDRRRALGKFDDSSKSTQTKWIPKPQIRSLPPL